jgi:hypothetical protein
LAETVREEGMAFPPCFEDFAGDPGSRHDRGV